MQVAGLRKDKPVANMDVRESTADTFRDSCINAMFCLLVGRLLFRSSINGVFDVLFGHQEIRLGDLSVDILLAVLAFAALPRILQSIKMADIAFLLTFAMLYGMSLLMSAGGEKVHFQILMDIVQTCLPGYFVAISIRNYRQLRKFLEITAYLIVIGMSYAFFFNRTMAQSTYSQGFGYQILAGTAILIYEVMDKKDWKIKLLDGGMLLFSIVLLIMAGARGPVMCAVGMVALTLLVKSIPPKPSTILILLMVLGAGIIIFISYDEIIDFLLKNAQAFGLSTRNLDALVSGEFFKSLARNNIIDYVLEYIRSHPFWGSGWINDRILIYQNVMPYAETGAIGTYPHNFFLEVMMQFGLIGGLALNLAILFQLAKQTFNRGDMNFRAIFLIMLTIGFFPLMVSGSYLDWPMFYMLIGASLGYRRNQRECKMADKNGLNFSYGARTRQDGKKGVHT